VSYGLTYHHIVGTEAVTTTEG